MVAPDSVGISNHVVWNPGLNTEPFARFAENGCCEVCLGVGLAMLVLVLRARHHRTAGVVKKQLFVGVRLSFVKSSQPRKSNGTGYPVRTHAFLDVTRFSTNNQGARIWNLSGNCPHAAWFAPSICHPLFCTAIVT